MCYMSYKCSTVSVPAAFLYIKDSRLYNYRSGIYDRRLSALCKHIMQCDILNVSLEKAGRLYLKSTRGHQPKRKNRDCGMNYDTSYYVG